MFSSGVFFFYICSGFATAEAVLQYDIMDPKKMTDLVRLLKLSDDVDGMVVYLERHLSRLGEEKLGSF